MTRRLLESEGEYVENVKKKLLDLHKLIPQEMYTDMFVMSIRGCVEKFWEYKSIQSGKWAWYMDWVKIKMSYPDALQIIEGEVIPLLKIAEDNIATYTSFRPQLLELKAYVKSWFDSTSQTSDVTIHEPSVGLQREVEKMKQTINTWELRYSSLEREYRKVQVENLKLASQNDALDNALTDCIADKNAKIKTQRGEIERLNREVERLQGEVQGEVDKWTWFKPKTNTDIKDGVITRMSTYEFDDGEMRACLQSVKHCLENLGKDENDIATNSLNAVYDTWPNKTGTLKSAIDFCLDETNPQFERNSKFNGICLDIQTLLDEMKNRLDYINERSLHVNIDAETAGPRIAAATAQLNALRQKKFWDEALTRNSKQVEEPSEQEGNIKSLLVELEALGDDSLYKSQGL